jgi:hypothetical protein
MGSILYYERAQVLMRYETEIETGQDWVAVEWECLDCSALNEFDSEAEWSADGLGEMFFTFKDTCKNCGSILEITEGREDTRHDPDPDFD